MADITYSAWSSGWKPKGSSVYKYYRVRMDTVLNQYDTYCTISYSVYLEINSTVGHNGYHWYTSTGASGSVNTVMNGAKLILCYSNTTGAINRTHADTSASVAAAIYTSSSGGTSPWNGGTVTASKMYTIPAKASYAIEYDPNEGTGSITDTKWFNEELTLSTGTGLSRANYTLLKWNTAADGSGTSYALGSSYTDNAALKLYAIWQQNPTCTATVSSSAPYYTGKASYSVTVANASAKGSASIASITLALGSQTASRTNNGSISITPSTAGTFTPTVTITDSLGTSTTYSMAAITVKQYVAPSVRFTLERVNSSGAGDESSGTRALIIATFSFCDDAYKLTAPTVSYTTTSTTSVTVSWYTTRNTTTGAVSGAVNWNNVTSGQTIYGLTTAVFATTTSYTISVTPKDNRPTTGTAKTQTLSVAIFPIDFYAGGGGVSFGKIATADGFLCAMEATFEGGILLALDDTAASGTDFEILQALDALGWDVTV